MSHIGTAIPFIFQNSSSFTPEELWFGHYTSKDKSAGAAPSMFYRGKPVGAGEVIQLGQIYIVTKSKDYWSLFYKYKGVLYGGPKAWYACEASSSYVAIRIALTGSPSDPNAELLCPLGPSGWAPFSTGKLGPVVNLTLNPNYKN